MKTLAPRPPARSPFVPAANFLREPHNDQRGPCDWLEDDRIVQDFQQELEKHSHFGGRCDLIQASARGGVLTLRGSVPTFYLKQLVQHVAQRIRGVQRIVNKITVFEPATPTTSWPLVPVAPAVETEWPDR